MKATLFRVAFLNNILVIIKNINRNDVFRSYIEL